MGMLIIEFANMNLRVAGLVVGMLNIGIRKLLPGLVVVLGDTFDPDENINFVQLTGFVMWDYDKVWHHWAPEALRFKVEGTAGLTTSPKTRGMNSVILMIGRFF